MVTARRVSAIIQKALNRESLVIHTRDERGIAMRDQSMSRAQLAAGKAVAWWFACALAVVGAARAQAQPAHETVLHNFPANAPLGANPTGGLVSDSAGNLYGTTNYGGTARLGVIFRIDPAGHKTILYNFPGGANGANPNGVTLDSAGNLYGTTSGGGSTS